MWIRVLMWILAGLSVATLVAAAWTRTRFIEFFWDSPAGPDRDAAHARWIDADRFHRNGIALSFLAATTILVLLMIWMFKAHAATDTLTSAPRRWGRGWTVGGWFIPIASLIIPKLVLDDIERVAKSPRHGDPADDRRQRAVRPSTLGWAWWLTLIVAIAVHRVSLAMLVPSTRIDGEQMRTGYTLTFVALAMFAVGNALGALHIAAIGRRLSSAAVQGPV